MTAVVLLAFGVAPAIQDWMQDAFYPVLFGILVLASLGLPIPEDLPLIAAGVLLHTHEGIATWPGTLFVALVGIMTGDLILYQLGRMWGMDVVNHRYVRRLITQKRLKRAIDNFHRYGMWFCFFGRFFVGVRAAMCMTAGATRFPYWRFFLADFAGAVLSVPLFIYLGYWFAGMLPTLQRYVTDAQRIIGVAVGLAVVAFLLWEYRHVRKHRRAVADAQNRRAERSAERESATLERMPPASPARPAQSPAAVQPAGAAVKAPASVGEL